MQIVKREKKNKKTTDLDMQVFSYVLKRVHELLEYQREGVLNLPLDNIQNP